MKKILCEKKVISVIYLILLFWMLAGYVIIPVFQTFLQAVTEEDGRNWAAILEYLQNDTNQKIIFNTVKLGIATVVVCGSVGISLAFYMTYRCRRFRNIIHILLLLPMMIPGTIIVIAFVQMYGETGSFTTILRYIFHLNQAPYTFGGFGGILFVHLCTQYVYFYLQTYVALKYVDYAEIEVARGMGANKWQIFKDIVFPVIKPAVVLSATMTFITGISSFAAPNIIGNGYKVLSTQIAMSKSLFNFQQAAVGSIILFFLGLFTLIIMQYNSRKSVSRRSLRASRYVPDRRGKITVMEILENLFVVCVLVLILFPILAIIYMSFVTTNSIFSQYIPHDFTVENYISVVQSKRTVGPFFNSLKMSLFAAIVGLAVTVPLSYMVSRKKTVIHRLAWFFVTMSWCIPGSVLAINLISAFNHSNIFSFGQVLIGGSMILPIAYTIHALPVLMNNNIVAMENFNSVLEDASRGLGAGRIQTIVKVVLPSVVPGIAAGAMLTIISTMGEYTISNLLYGVHNTPISVTMLNRFLNYYIGEAMAYAVIIIAFCGILFTLVLRFDRKRQL